MPSDAMCCGLTRTGTAYTQPDHTGEQYKCMVQALDRIVQDKGWEETNTWVWVDIISIPQRCKAMQQLAINSLSCYASVAHAFAIVAPPVAHRETGQPLDATTYNRRMWCRTENLCHTLRHGTHSMWLADSAGVSRLEHDQGFLKANLRVFEAEATVEEDKLSLVLPVLGLYAELYAADYLFVKDTRRRSSPPGVRAVVARSRGSLRRESAMSVDETGVQVVRTTEMARSEEAQKRGDSDLAEDAVSAGAIPDWAARGCTTEGQQSPLSLRQRCSSQPLVGSHVLLVMLTCALFSPHRR